MKFISLFSGIDAASVAWQPLGWKAAAFAEIEAFPSAVLAHRYPDVPNLGDVTEADFDAVGPVDIVVGGSPCQSFSVAGKRLGMDDPRGNLALVYGQVVYRKRPRWFVYENVPGLLSSDSGRDFGTLIAAFAGYPPGSLFEPPEGGWRGSGVIRETKGGYGVAWRVLDAQYVRVDGFGRAVPQRRRRVFVVGHIGDWRRAAAVLFERESLCGNPPPRREAGKSVAHDVAPSLVSSGRGVERGGDTRGQDPIIAVKETAATPTRGAESSGKGGYAGRRQEDDENLVARCVTASQTRLDWETETFVLDIAGTMPAAGGTEKKHGHGWGQQEWENGYCVAHALRADGFDASEDGTGRGTPIVPMLTNGNEGANGGGIGVDGDPAFPLQASVQQGVGIGWRVRRLTPTECERLQGFPDGYTAISNRGKSAADGPRYKALGNSMAVNVMRWIGWRIDLVESLARARVLRQKS